MTGPLGRLPKLSPSTRTALAGYGLLAVARTLALIGFAWGLATTLGSLVHGPPQFGPLWIVACCVLARGVLAWASQVLANRAAARAKQELRTAAVDGVLTKGPEFVSTHGPAELSRRVTEGLEAIDEYFTGFLPALLASVIIAPGIGIAILVWDPISALIIAITVPLLPVFAILIGWYTKRRVDAAAEESERLAAHLGQLIGALPVLRAFGRARAQTEAVARVSHQSHRGTLRTLRIAFCSALSLEVVSSISVALVAVGIGLRLVGGELDLGTGLLVLLLAPECYLALRQVGAAFHASADGLSAVDSIAELQDVGVVADPDGVLPGPLRHQLRVRGLRVARRAGYAPDGVELSLRPGEVTRLDWPSGSGKSTLIGVLLGFTAPEAGSITIDGAELAIPAHWRRHIAWIPQRPRLLGPTVADELQLSTSDQAMRPDAETVRRICARVHAQDLLERPVDELSAGERARVAIACALLRVECGATVLLADEPTAHLDQVNAAAAMRAIKDCGAAVLLAAHRTVEAGEPEIGDTTAIPRTSERTTPARERLRLLGSRASAGIALGVLATASGIALTATSAWLIARAAQQPPILTLTVAIVAVRAFGLGKGVLRYAERIATHDAAFRIATTLRTRLWSALARIGPAAVRDREHAHRMVADIDAVRDGIPRVLHPPIIATVLAIGALAVQTAILPAAGLVLAIALLLAGVCGPLLGALAERRATVALAEDRRTLALRIGELFGHIDVLLANGSDQLWRARVRELDGRLLERGRKRAFGAGIAAAINTIALGAASVLSVLLGAGLNPVLVPVLALLPLACSEFTEPLATALTRLPALRAASERIGELLAAPTPSSVGVSTGEHIELHGADIAWPDNPETPVLRGVELRIPAGSTVAVTGPSGSGKSTLLAVLLGFLAPQRGTATIPETSAIAPQDPRLVSTTLAENLRIADRDADMETLAAALRTAGLGHFVEHLNERIDPSTVSGGEAGRISIARALLAVPRSDAVLLDEPTAHLDRETAAALAERLALAFTARTVIQVTHHPEELEHADIVLEVRDGTVCTVRGPAPVAASA